jgi:hypothetical protein
MVNLNLETTAPKTIIALKWRLLEWQLIVDKRIYEWTRVDKEAEYHRYSNLSAIPSAQEILQDWEMAQYHRKRGKSHFQESKIRTPISRH